VSDQKSWYGKPEPGAPRCPIVAPAHSRGFSCARDSLLVADRVLWLDLLGNVQVEFSIFYAWQSDSPRKCNLYFIEHAIQKAIKKIGKDVTLELSPRLGDKGPGVVFLAVGATHTILSPSPYLVRTHADHRPLTLTVLTSRPLVPSLTGG
jgi:hypothetical protein